MMKTEKRKANVGERILITKATEAQGNFENGDVSTVVETGVFGESGTVRVREHVRPIYESEYEVIVETPKKSERITALETQVAELQAKVDALVKAEKAPAEHDTLISKYPLTAQFERFVDVKVDEILADIKRKAKTPNEQRADVIKRAKAFVGEGFSRWFGTMLCTVEFIVNSDKRTVVALLRWKRNNNAVVSKGIAKCDPDDVFNADIGKAIALARAIGVEVPNEFVKAVQPTEVVVGQIVTWGLPERTYTIGNGMRVINVQNGRDYTDYSEFYYAIIKDDTDAVYE